MKINAALIFAVILQAIGLVWYVSKIDSKVDILYTTFEEENQKDAFCSPALVELKDGKVVTLHSELPEGAVMVNKKVSKEALKEWTLKAKEKWNDSK